jgi:hypothetical protein
LSLLENFEKNAYANCFRYKTEKWWSTKVKLPVEIGKKYGNKILLRK